ncbi:MAG TPA: hypothetical protein VGS10_18015 [Terracidiphilus sp.]|nr:hypothetical protein [Terracidiphilus sp.]
MLQQFFAYGLFGIALLAGVYGSLYRRIRGLPLAPEQNALTSFLIYVAVRGLAEGEPFDFLLPLWLVTSFGFVLQQGDRQLAAAGSDAAA